MHLNGCIRILAYGPFGNAVGEHLTVLSRHDQRAVQVVGVRDGIWLRRFLAGGDLGILASFRDAASDVDAFAAAAASAGVAWLPVALGLRHVRVGPLVVPGAAPCSSCYSARLAQHRQAAGTASADLEHAFEQDDALGVEGYPPHIAAIAAGLALRLARSPACGGVASRLFLIDIASDAVAAWKVIGVQGCLECDSAANARGAVAKRSERLRTLAAEICPSPGDVVGKTL
jgi:bacteriocin biosynthesis cyclodehydratase domain-containing protein